MRTFDLKIIAEWNICTGVYHKITLSQSECSLMSHDVMLSVQTLYYLITQRLHPYGMSYNKYMACITQIQLISTVKPL